MSNLPLEGVRVLDMGRFWAGPQLGLNLGYLGAEVVKLESCSSPDPVRMFARGIVPKGPPEDDYWNRSGLINERNRNKYGLALDLKTPKGHEIFRSLVGKADALTENFSTDGAETLGLSYSALQEMNPRIIWLSLRSRGDTGPEKDRVSFGTVLEACSGVIASTGYENEVYQFSSQGLPDFVGATVATGLVIAGLYYRRRTGKSLHIDISQLEGASCLVAEAFMQYFITGEVAGPTGNHHPVWSPRGCYRCRGTDEWVAISVSSDEQWERLCSVMGKPELARDTRFTDLVERYKNQRDIDPLIEEWSRKLGAYDVMARLQREGIAAAPVLKANQLLEDPHFMERDLFQRHVQPGVGTYRHWRLPMLFSEAKLSVRLPAPRLGEHNRLILSSWLGMTDNDIDQLEREGVIGTEPLHKVR